MVSAGFRTLAVPDGAGPRFPCLLLHPAEGPERETDVGGYPAVVSAGTPPSGGDLPLVVISHGSGSRTGLHRTLAAHLARSGFVVAVPQHPGNHRDDNSRAADEAILVDRTRHVRAVVDHLLADPDIGPVIDADRLAIVGHSLGGCTALALAGGHLPVPVEPDPRVRAVVLLAPATPWFADPASLSDVAVPVMLLNGTADTLTPPWHAENVVRGVPADLVEHHPVEGAGHFSFFSPFPPGLVSDRLAPSQDPAGFDRATFHERMKADIASFLHRALA